MLRHGLLCIGLLVVTATGASAQDVRKPMAVVHGDVSIPIAPQQFADGFSLGLGGGAGMAFPLWSRIGVVAAVDYKAFAVDEQGFKESQGLPPTANLSGDRVSSFYASLSLKFDFLTAPSQIIPYVIGGLGYFRFSPNDFAVNGTPIAYESQDALGVNIGGGLELVVAPYLGLFLDAVYVVGFIEGEDTSYLTIRPGIAFDLKAGQ